MSLFGFGGGLFGNTSNNMNMNILSDYAAIKSGSYYKLMKAYYGGNNKVDSIVSNMSSGKTATSKDSAKKLTSVESSADSLKESVDALNKQGSKSVFNLVDVEQEDGTKTKGYDVDAIYKKVNQFVERYNDLLDSTDEISSDSIERAVKNLTNVSKSHSRMLASVGINIKADGSLSLDKETFKEADMNKVKELFTGTGSYGYQVSARASMVDYAAEREASKANTYNRYGAYSNNYNYSFNGYM